jgi:hypothetical protein
MSFLTQKVCEAICVALLLALLGVGFLYATTHAKLTATQLVLAQTLTQVAELKSAVEVSNAKVEEGGRLKAAAEARGDRARAAADVSTQTIRGLITKLDQQPKVKVVSCTDAMPTVNAILGGLK